MDGELDTERRAGRRAARGDTAAVARDDGTADRQAEAHAVGLGRKERLEQACAVGVGDARTAVAYADKDHAVVPARAQFQAAGREAVHRLQGVHHQVDQDLLQLDAVAHDGRQAGRQVDAQCQRAPVQLALQQLDRV
ncbi:conserved hypothetical protein, partial [Ricinus communis]